MKDREITRLVSELTKTAIDYRDTQQLRERIKTVLTEALQPPMKKEIPLKKKPQPSGRRGIQLKKTI